MNFSILKNYIFCLFKSYLPIHTVSFTFIKVFEADLRPFCFIRIIKDHFHNIIDHFEFLFIETTVVERSGDILGLVFTKIFIQPHPDFPFLVNHDLPFGDMESLNFGVKLLVSIEHGQRAIEVIRIGDVLIVTESGSTVLDVHIQHVGSPTELLHYFGLVMHHPHNVLLISSVLDGVDVILIFLFVGEAKGVFVQQLPSLLVPHHHEVVIVIV